MKNDGNSGNANALTLYEFVTEALEYSQLRDVLAMVVQFLTSKRVRDVRVEFGFVVQRDLRGLTVPDDCVVPIGELDSFIEAGLEEGTIEWAGTSDFCFFAIGEDLKFTLCNDADLHCASHNATLLADVSRALSAAGIKVYEPT